MSAFYYKSVEHDESAITVTLSSHDEETWEQRLVIGIEQFESALSGSPMARIGQSPQSGVSPFCRMPGPVSDESRNKTCPTCGGPFYDDSQWGNRQYCKNGCRPSAKRVVLRDKLCIGCGCKFHDDSRCNNMQYHSKECRMEHKIALDGQSEKSVGSMPKKRVRSKISKPKKKPSGQYPNCLWCGHKNPDPTKPYCKRSHEKQAEAYKLYSEGSEI